MSEELENEVRDLLKEEIYTRAGINNFTPSNIESLNNLLARIRDEGSMTSTSVKDICNEQLSHSKDNIVALYISGMLSIYTGSLDTSALSALVEIFYNNHKETLVEMFCKHILETHPNNMFALKNLAAYYKNTNNPELWTLYERIVKIDLEDADVAKALAERYEEQKSPDTAISYYKKALLRYVAAKNPSGIKEMWSKLVYLIPEDIDFFMMVQKKIEKTVSEDKSALLLQELYQYYKDTSKWDTAIEILKTNLRIDNKDAWARREIIECFRGKYSDRPRLEDYIRTSNLEQSYRNIFDAITEFEKHISFDTKNFVFHRSWGVGLIKKVEGDMLIINFGKKNGIHEISLKMAVTALQPLAKDHIWVLKATKTRAELSEKVKKDIVWTLKTIIKSFDNKCDEKRIKAELVPSILTAGEWTSWHAKAQDILKKNATFGVNPSNINQYMVREKEARLEERISNEFKAEKEFFPRIEILMRYMDNEETDKQDELFSDMYSYFASFIKSFSNVDKQIVAAYLVVLEVIERLPNFKSPADFTFAQMYEEIENPKKMYEDLKTEFLRHKFLQCIRTSVPDWDEQFIKLFPTVLKKEIIIDLITDGKQDMVQKLVQESFENFRNYRDAAVYFFRESRNEEWFQAVNISYEKQLVTLINIIALCYREINNHVNTVDNKKTIKAACTSLFAEKADKGEEPVNNVLNYMLDKDEYTITRMYTTINDVKDLDSTYKAQLRSGILGRFPDFKFQESEVKHEVQKGMLTTARMLDIKKKEAEELEKVILPKIADEVSEAREKGDLKENAEYHSARERQALENDKLSKLKNMLAQAVTFDPSTRTTSYVSFGTVVSLHNAANGTDLTYTILGPFESNPDEGIISYLSPFGDRLLDMKVGENRKFSINDTDYDITITSITAASDV